MPNLTDAQLEEFRRLNEKNVLFNVPILPLIEELQEYRQRDTAKIVEETARRSY